MNVASAGGRHRLQGSPIARALRSAAMLGLAGLFCLGVAPDPVRAADQAPGTTPPASPDWNGVWEMYEVGAGGRAVHAEEGPQSLAAMTEMPPYKPDWLARFQAENDQRRKASGSQTILCNKDTIYGVGMPDAVRLPIIMFQSLVAPRETALFLYPGGVRHIDTDGRQHPSNDDLLPSALGDSIGRWEGNELVVDTIGLSGPLFVRTSPTSPDYSEGKLSEKARVIERYRLIDQNTLEVRITVQDPEAFSHDWQMVRRFHRVPQLRHILEGACENDPYAKGNSIFSLPSPK